MSTLKEARLHVFRTNKLTRPRYMTNDNETLLRKTTSKIACVYHKYSIKITQTHTPTLRKAKLHLYPMFLQSNTSQTNDKPQYNETFLKEHNLVLYMP